MAGACGQNGSDAVVTQQTAALAPEPPAGATESPSGEQKAQPCLSCHSLDNFASFDVPRLEAFMQSMRTGEMAHPPLPDSVSDADVAEIAAYLAGVEADG